MNMPIDPSDYISAYEGRNERYTCANCGTHFDREQYVCARCNGHFCAECFQTIGFPKFCYGCDAQEGKL